MTLTAVPCRYLLYINTDFLTPNLVGVGPSPFVGGGAYCGGPTTGHIACYVLCLCTYLVPAQDLSTIFPHAVRGYHVHENVIKNLEKVMEMSC